MIRYQRPRTDETNRGTFLNLLMMAPHSAGPRRSFRDMVRRPSRSNWRAIVSSMLATFSKEPASRIHRRPKCQPLAVHSAEQSASR